MKKLTPKQKQRLRLLINALTEKKNKYRYGKGRLYNPKTTTWCWAGVATDIYFEKTHQGSWLDVENLDTTFGIAYFNRNGEQQKIFLPTDILDWYGFTPEEHANLIDINDASTSSFDPVVAELNKKLQG